MSRLKRLISEIHERSLRPVLAGLLVLSCAGCETGPAPLTAEVPLHLEEHLDAATIVGSEVPEDVSEPVEWRFDEPQPDWKATPPWNANPPARLTGTAEGLLVTLTDAMRNRGGNPRGGIHINVRDFEQADWDHVVIRARSENEVSWIGVHFNLREGSGASTDQPFPYEIAGEGAPVIRDGTVQTYRFQIDLAPPEDGTLEELGLWFRSNEPGSIVVLSVTLVSKAALYAEAPHGVRPVTRGRQLRRTLYTHAPGRLEYHVKVPDAGRLDLGLGVLLGNAPVTFAITAQRKGGEAETLLEETYADQDHWAQRSVDLSHLAGQTVTLALEAEAERAGTVALWAAPTLSGARTSDIPNIIFYVIDGAGADYMSVYGYNRRTTPNLERLAAEGAVFERAYSNSSWTKISTPSFMTSLQSSVLGGFGSESDPLPEQAVTMAQRLHGAGYQTAVYAANPFAGTISSLDRGADALRESWTEFSYFDDRHNQSVSSTFLHGSFWRWRKAYPGEPYWVHFQTTDVHYPWKPVAPFAGLFISPELRERYNEWQRQLVEAGGGRGGDSPDSAAFAATGISPVAHFNARRRLYDETMSHQDHQLGRLVERLKAAGEWQHTLLIVAADHGHWAARLSDPSSPRWGPVLSSSVSRVPLIIVWPGRIAGGQRLSQPVSMIDMLPTILDVIGVPMPEVMQGQSLAPLLLGEEGWEPRPVILDEFYVDQETGGLGGFIEVIDGRWGASLLIGHPPQRGWKVFSDGRPNPLLLYDLWNDPMCLHSLHEERPDLVEKYTAFLEEQFEAHQALAQYFTRSGEVVLTPEQLETLRALGYIQ